MFAALQELLISRDCLGGFSDGNLKPVLDSVFSLEVHIQLILILFDFVGEN